MADLTLGRNLPKAIVVVGLALGIVVFLRADAQPPAAGKSQLAKDLIGTWVLAGTPDKIEQPPATGGRYKLIVGGHWTVTQADPQTGKVTFHHGGTYTLDGDQYTESVDYANENTADLIGQKFKFKVMVEKDIFTNVGIGNPWTEAWKRAK